MKFFNKMVQYDFSNETEKYKFSGNVNSRDDGSCAVSGNVYSYTDGVNKGFLNYSIDVNSNINLNINSVPADEYSYIMSFINNTITDAVSYISKK